MTHIDADALALIALGDVTPSDADRAHLAGCATCSAELSELSHTVQLGRSVGDTELVAPPAAVWSRIRTELDLDVDLDRAANPAEARAQAAAPVAAPVLSRTETSTGRPAIPALEIVPPSETDAPAHHVGRRRTTSRRSRIWAPLAAAALVLGLVAGTGAGIWWQTTQQQAGGIAIAGAELDPFPDWPDARGSAVVEQSADGRRQVVVDIDSTDSAADSAPLREVWLIRSDGTGLVSIGFLNGPEGRFDVPADIDLVQYSLVDISAETDDGDPTHSGDSIVRGQLRAL